MLSAVLQRLVDQGKLTSRQVAVATGCDESNLYKWISGVEPRWTAMAQLVQHTDRREVQQAILDLMVAGTSWQCIWLPAHNNIDGDGDIDLDDAMAKALEAVHAATKEVEELHAMAKDGNASDARVAELAETASLAIAGIVVARRIVQQTHAMKSHRRRAAKPVLAPEN